MAEITTLAGFNPLPAVRPGGTDHWQHSIRWRVSFNPLPAVRPGGTVGDDGTPVFTKVSIRSRLLGREERRPLLATYGVSLFQSAPGC